MHHTTAYAAAALFAAGVGASLPASAAATEAELLRQELAAARTAFETRVAALEARIQQLEGVLRVCRAEPNISAAGRKLFGVSRTRKQVANDADRLRKYLARFGLSWESGREKAT